MALFVNCSRENVEKDGGRWLTRGRWVSIIKKKSTATGSCPQLLQLIKVDRPGANRAVNTLLWTARPAKPPGMPEHEAQKALGPSTSATTSPLFCICLGVLSVGQPPYVTALFTPLRRGVFIILADGAFCQLHGKNTGGSISRIDSPVFSLFHWGLVPAGHWRGKLWVSGRCPDPAEALPLHSATF